MDRILHNVDNAHKILQLTSDTLILVDKNGTCLDIDPHSDLWFLQEDRLLGKNLFNFSPRVCLLAGTTNRCVGRCPDTCRFCPPTLPTSDPG